MSFARKSLLLKVIHHTQMDLQTLQKPLFSNPTHCQWPELLAYQHLQIRYYSLRRSGVCKWYDKIWLSWLLNGLQWWRKDAHCQNSTYMPLFPQYSHGEDLQQELILPMEMFFKRIKLLPLKIAFIWHCSVCMADYYRKQQQCGTMH